MELLIGCGHVALSCGQLSSRNSICGSSVCNRAAVKRICRYLQGAITKGLILKPSKQLTVDCFVDADFAGQWNVENPEDPLCVKSRTGYVLLVRNCPVQWASKLLSEILVSMMEAEYISLSTAMRDLIPLRTLVDEVKDLIWASTLLC